MSAAKATDRDLALRHKYRLPNGELAVSVTAISGLLDIDGKSSAFAGAAVKLTREGLNYREEWKAKGERGTRIHGHCEAFLRGEEIDQLDEDAGFVDALEKFMADHDPEVIHLEEIVLSDKGYGGRFDMIVSPRTGPYAGQTLLVDLKTGRKYPVEVSMQLAAYRYADGIARYDEDGALAGVEPLPSVDLCAGLYVAEDGNYDLTPYPADEMAYATFCALLRAHKWAHTDEMKALTKEARGR